MRKEWMNPSAWVAVQIRTHQRGVFDQRSHRVTSVIISAVDCDSKKHQHTCHVCSVLCWSTIHQNCESPVFNLWGFRWGQPWLLHSDHTQRWPASQGILAFICPCLPAEHYSVPGLTKLTKCATLGWPRGLKVLTAPSLTSSVADAKTSTSVKMALWLSTKCAKAQLWMIIVFLFLCSWPLNIEREDNEVGAISRSL